MQEAVDHYEFDILREKHIEEAARMSAKSFQDMNKVWQSYNPTNDVVYQFMKEKILLALAN